MKEWMVVVLGGLGFVAVLAMTDGGSGGYVSGDIYQRKADAVERRVWEDLGSRAIRVDDTMARVERRLYQSGDQEAIGDWEGMSYHERRKFAAHLERRGW